MLSLKLDPAIETRLKWEKTSLGNEKNIATIPRSTILWSIRKISSGLENKNKNKKEQEQEQEQYGQKNDFGKKKKKYKKQ